MARARNIKPAFFRNAELVELSFEARLFFIGLWTAADRDGRLEDRPKQIKMEIFPADSVDCDALLRDLAAIKMIERYEVDGKRFIQVTNFSKHQNPHRDEKPSSIPAPRKHGANTVQAPCKDDALTMPIGLIPDSLLLIPDSSTKDTTPDGVVCPRPAADGPQLALVEPAEPGSKPRAKAIPDCPHVAVLALWAEVLPSMPQHNADQWRGSRADHLRARWRETATAKGWESQEQGLTYFRRLFVHVGRSAFLTGREHDPKRRPFFAELAWLVEPLNWAKTHEGKFHQEAAA